MTELSRTDWKPAAPIEARRWTLGGRVQGVGFRPFVYRLAHAHGLQGWVRNTTGQVEIHAQGRPADLEAFAEGLLRRAPPLARPQLRGSVPAVVQRLRGFRILRSAAEAPHAIHVPPDYFVCDDCLEELEDPSARRYRYPFINCTQCGPRYTIIRRLPYDRPNTTMAGFTLCDACRAEYEDPLDRRFHAQPLACPACGPELHFQFEGSSRVVGGNEAALAACIETLRAGEIVAVKGVGGYHLVCDARRDDAIRRLRASKPRPHKPLAVMFPGRGRSALQRLQPYCELEPAAAGMLLDPMRPIVLVPRRAGSDLSELVAPQLREIGVFLPYSPLHHLLLEAYDAPLVMTSGNITGEPVLTDNAEADVRLGHVAHAFLHHNRPIQRPADDPVFRVIAGQARPLRLGRGCAPLEIALPKRLPVPVLAVGGHMKNTIALGWEDRAIVSPHIGDLDAVRSIGVFEQVIEDLQELYQVRAMQIACDAHPGYASTRWARDRGRPLHRVQHHRAHASALAGEHPDVGRWLTFTWDGVGYGDDETLWGGEVFHGRPGDWTRVATLRAFALPGGERASREPIRSALGICWEAGESWDAAHYCNHPVLRHAWERSINCPRTSAVGRLFDAAAALTEVCTHSSFEGQGPMLLEAVARADADAVALPLRRRDDSILEIDWAPLLPVLMDERLDVAERAGRFHASLAQVIAQIAQRVRAERGFDAVGLCGGVFQNRLLAESAVARLSAAGIPVLLNEQVPCNDGGISFGQLVEVAYKL